MSGEVQPRHRRRDRKRKKESLSKDEYEEDRYVVNEAFYSQKSEFDADEQEYEISQEDEGTHEGNEEEGSGIIYKIVFFILLLILGGLVTLVLVETNNENSQSPLSDTLNGEKEAEVMNSLPLQSSQSGSVGEGDGMDNKEPVFPEDLDQEPFGFFDKMHQMFLGDIFEEEHNTAHEENQNNEEEEEAYESHDDNEEDPSPLESDAPAAEELTETEDNEDPVEEQSFFWNNEAVPEEVPEGDDTQKEADQDSGELEHDEGEPAGENFDNAWSAFNDVADEEAEAEHLNPEDMNEEVDVPERDDSSTSKEEGDDFEENLNEGKESAEEVEPIQDENIEGLPYSEFDPVEGEEADWL